jgi:hypothetical protein
MGYYCRNMQWLKTAHVISINPCAILATEILDLGPFRIVVIVVLVENLGSSAGVRDAKRSEVQIVLCKDPLGMSRDSCGNHARHISEESPLISTDLWTFPSVCKLSAVSDDQCFTLTVWFSPHKLLWTSSSAVVHIYNVQCKRATRRIEGKFQASKTPSYIYKEILGKSHSSVTKLSAVCNTHEIWAWNGTH